MVQADVPEYLIHAEASYPPRCKEGLPSPVTWTQAVLQGRDCVPSSAYVYRVVQLPSRSRASANPPCIPPSSLHLIRRLVIPTSALLPLPH